MVVSFEENHSKVLTVRECSRKMWRQRAVFFWMRSFNKRDIFGFQVYKKTEKLLMFIWCFLFIVNTLSM